MHDEGDKAWTAADVVQWLEQHKCRWLNAPEEIVKLPNPENIRKETDE